MLEIQISSNRIIFCKEGILQNIILTHLRTFSILFCQIDTKQNFVLLKITLDLIPNKVYDVLNVKGYIMKLFLDDVRHAPKGWIRTHNVESTINLLKSNRVTKLSLDHDLGIDGQ